MTTAFCAKIQAWLSAYLDGELDDRRRSEMDAHLAICSDCREELAALQRTSAVLRCWQTPEVDPQLSVTFTERLAKHAAQPDRREFAYPRLAWAGAMVVVLLISALVARQPERHLSSNPTMTTFETRGNSRSPAPEMIAGVPLHVTRHAISKKAAHVVSKGGVVSMPPAVIIEKGAPRSDRHDVPVEPSVAVVETLAETPALTPALMAAPPAKQPEQVVVDMWAETN